MNITQQYHSDKSGDIVCVKRTVRNKDLDKLTV